MSEQYPHVNPPADKAGFVLKSVSGSKTPEINSDLTVDRPADPTVTVDRPVDPTVTVDRAVDGKLTTCAAVLRSNPEELANKQIIVKLGGQKYEILGLLGEGGQGSVVLARDMSLNRIVAIKQAHITNGGTPDPGKTASLQAEGMISAQFEHDNIVPIYHMGIEKDDEGKDKCWIVYKYVRGGGTLDSKVSKLCEFITGSLTAGEKSAACEAISDVLGLQGQERFAPETLHASKDKLVISIKKRNPEDLPELLQPFLNDVKSKLKKDHPLVKTFKSPSSNLEDYISTRNELQNPIKPKEAAILIRKMALALDHVHDMKYCHRDIKPANILLDEKKYYEPYLADFGVVMRLDQPQKHPEINQCAGTPSYMSPEQAMAHPKLNIKADARSNVDARSDVFSLGIVLHELLSGGKQLFPIAPGEGFVRVLQSIASKDKIAPPQSGGRAPIPAELVRICMKALEKDPAKRYQTAAAMADDLKEFLEKEKPKPRNWLGPALVTTGILATGAGALTFTNNPFRRDTAPKPADTSWAGKVDAPKRLPKTSFEDIEGLREWSVTEDKKVNLFVLLEPAYQKLRSPQSPQTVEVRQNETLVAKPNQLTHFMEAFYGSIFYTPTLAELEYAITTPMVRLKNMVDGAIRHADDKAKPFGLLKKDFDAYLEANKLEDTPAVRKKLNEGVVYYQELLEDYRAFVLERIAERKVVEESVSVKLGSDKSATRTGPSR